MNKRIVSVLVVAAFLLPVELGRTQQPQQPPPPVPESPSRQVVTVELVNLLATVLDRRQRFVTDLQKENFRVYEDNQLQALSFFSRETDLPLRVGLLLDTSNSIRDRLQFEKDAAIDFLHATVRRHVDLAFLMTFDTEATVLHEYTDDLNTLQEVILRQRAGAVVYTISTSTDWLSFSGDKTPTKYHKTEGDQVLEQFSDETGGRAFYPYRIDDLAQSFADIGTELRSQYSLAYTPKNRRADGAFRRIKVEVDRKGLSVRTRKGYYAPRPETRPARPASDPSN